MSPTLVFVAVAIAWVASVRETWCFPLAATVDRIANHNNSLYVQDIMRLAKAAEMHNYMNESIDPCNDFYEFACGNWAKINPANSVESITTGLFQVMSKAFNRKVERMLKAGAEPEDNDIDRKVKDFYESCTRIRFIDSNSGYTDKLLEIIAEFGEMPAISGAAWNAKEFDWLETVARIAHKYGKGIIISIDILPDFVNNTVNRPYIGHPDLPLESKSMYVDAVTAIYREAYKDKIAKDLQQYLALQAKLAKQTAHEIVEFEVSLARGMIDEKLGLGVDDISLLTTVDAMSAKYAPILDVAKLVNISLGVAYNEPIYEFVEQYQRNLVEIMRTTSQRIVANYIMYTMLDAFILNVSKTQPKQDKLCIDKTKKYFAKNLDNMIYRRYNNDITERDVNLIWQQLKQTFQSELQSNKLDWITWQTRELAIEKLHAMTMEINSYKNDNFTEEFGELQIKKDDYIANIKNINELSSRQAIAELYAKPKPLEAGEILSYTPANIILENAIKVPVSLLQPNYLWAANYPNALKFGTIGTLIGHELIHGFDDNGRKYDKNGNHLNWWDMVSASAFNRQTQCFVEQYSQYLYGGRLLPKSASQSENIADNGGVRLAYASYLRWLQQVEVNKANLHLETLPTMSYTSKQLFFISYAQVWCNDAHPRVRDLQTSLDTHVPGKFRVIGPLANFPEFAKEFNCGKNTRMNSSKRCEIY